MTELSTDPDPTRGNYVIQDVNDEFKRLRALASRQADNVRDACRRAGLSAGATAIDIGCGPIGALSVLSEIVGPTGRLVGLDASQAVLDKGRAILDQDGLATVQLIRADLNTLLPAQVCPPGPFDLAFCRAVLQHQRDPEAALARIAKIVRPGGCVIVQDAFPYPAQITFDPPVPAMNRVWELASAAARARGSAVDLPHHYAATCRAVGLREICQRAFSSGGPSLSADYIRTQGIQLLEGVSAALLNSGLVTEAEICTLVAELTLAANREYQTFWGVPLGEVIAQVP